MFCVLNFTFAIFFKLFLTVNNIGLVLLNELVVLVSPKRLCLAAMAPKQ